MAGFNDWSTTPASNASVGAINFSEGQLPATLNNSNRQEMADLRYELGAISAAVSAGSTTDLGSIQEGVVVLSGNATIARFGATGTPGLRKKIRFTGTPTIQHSTGGIICPGSADITVAAGDAAEAICESSNVWRIYGYQRASGEALVGGLEINGLTAESAPAISDQLAMYDSSVSANRKITLEDVLKVINGLTADASPDTSADYVATYDASASSPKKVLLNAIGMSAASQAEMETASSTTVAVTPGRQHYHPSAAKAWVNWDADGTIAIQTSYNVSSITDNGVGDYTINFSVTFSSTEYCAVAFVSNPGAQGGVGVNYNVAAKPGGTRTATAFQVIAGAANTVGALDFGSISAAIFGDI